MQNLNRFDKLESEYYKYLKFQTDALYKQYAHYLKFFKEADSILDLGCGYGHFLELIKRDGKIGLGVDRDKGMIEVARKKGLDVIEEDIFSFLRGNKTKFDGIFSAHLIEHLGPKETIQFFHLCRNALNDQGIILIVAPNPANLSVHLDQFWKDATHVRLYDRQLVEFLLHFCEFDIVESGENPEAKDNRILGIQGVNQLLKYEHSTLNPLKVFKRILAKLLVKYILNHQISILTHQISVINNHLGINVSREIYVVGRK